MRLAFAPLRGGLLTGYPGGVAWVHTAVSTQPSAPLQPAQGLCSEAVGAGGSATQKLSAFAVPALAYCATQMHSALHEVLQRQRVHP